MDTQVLSSHIQAMLEELQYLRGRVTEESEAEILKIELFDLVFNSIVEIRELSAMQSKLRMESQKIENSNSPSSNLVKFVVMEICDTQIWEHYSPKIHLSLDKGFIGEIVSCETPLTVTGKSVPVGEVGFMIDDTKVKVLAHIDLK